MDAEDLDGHARIFGGGRVDMGAYEYQGSISMIPTNWLAQYGLPIDGSDDYGDEESNLFEYPVYELDEFPEGTESVIDFTTSTRGAVHYRVVLE